MEYFVLLLLLTEVALLHAKPSVKHCKTSTPQIDWDCRNRVLKGIPYDVFDDTNAQVKLGNNPFKCDCSMLWFLREPDHLKKNIKDLEDLTCDYPKKFAKRKITSLKEQEICPGAMVSRSKCREYRSEKMLTCSTHAIKLIPYDIFETKWPEIYISGFFPCDCKMTWFIRRLKNDTLANRITNPDLIECSSPRKLRFRRFIFLTEQDVCPQEDPDFCSMKPCNEIVSRCENKKEYYTCKDIDECKEGSHSCHETEDCVNVAHGYQCKCKTGLIKAKDGKGCIDFKACTEQKKVCPAHAKCLNTSGIYKCHCKEGFAWKGPRCVDIDECKTKIHDCDKNAVCKNHAGGFTCKCKKGFHNMEDGRICLKRKVDVDECAKKTHTCDRNAVCENVIGGYRCRCREGYDDLKEGRLCVLKKDTPLSLDNIDTKTRAFIGGCIAIIIISMATIICLCRRKRKKESTPSSKAKDDEALYYLDPNIQCDMMAMAPLLPDVQSGMSEYDKDFDEQSSDEGMDYDQYQSLSSLK